MAELILCSGTVVHVEPPEVPTLRTAAPPPGSTVFVVPVAGPRGPQGPPGDPGEVAGQLRLTRTAEITLSGHRAVTPGPDGTLRYASNTDIGALGAPIWLTLGATAAHDQVDVLVYGALTEPSWSWTPGPIYLGTDGALTQTPPTADEARFLTQLGFATTPTSAFLDRQPSLALTQE